MSSFVEIPKLRHVKQVLINKRTTDRRTTWRHNAFNACCWWTSNEHRQWTL